MIATVNPRLIRSRPKAPAENSHAIAYPTVPVLPYIISGVAATPGVVYWRADVGWEMVEREGPRPGYPPEATSIL